MPQKVQAVNNVIDSIKKHIKKAPRKPREALKLLLAERVGFEPTVPCGTIDFESITFDHSDTSP